MTGVKLRRQPFTTKLDFCVLVTAPPPPEAELLCCRHALCITTPAACMRQRHHWQHGTCCLTAIHHCLVLWAEAQGHGLNPCTYTQPVGLQRACNGQTKAALGRLEEAAGCIVEVVGRKVAHSGGHQRLWQQEGGGTGRGPPLDGSILFVPTLAISFESNAWLPAEALLLSATYAFCTPLSSQVQ